MCFSALFIKMYQNGSRARFLAVLIRTFEMVAERGFLNNFWF